MMLRATILVLGATLTVSTAQAAERKFSIFGFDEVRVAGDVNVTITTGQGPSARAEGDSQLSLDAVSLTRNGNTIVISRRDQALTSKQDNIIPPVRIFLTTQAVKAVTMTGSGSVSLDRLKGSTVSATIGGNGTLAINTMAADVLNARMRGAGSMTLGGMAKQGRVDITGPGIIDGSGLTIGALDLIHRGPATSSFAVTREAKIDNSGTGSITITGDPNCLVRSAGSASIICGQEN